MDIKDCFSFVPSLDEIGHDISIFKGDGCLEKHMEDALVTPGCVAFNTLGYKKYKITALVHSQYFQKGDGLYIVIEEKKQEYLKLTLDLAAKTVHTLEIIHERYPIIMNDVFVESGTHLGEGVFAAIRLGFKKIHSIELSSYHYELCKDMFADNPNVTIHFGDSGKILGDIIENEPSGVTFWLDGHFSSGITACAEEYCSPIKLELDAIKRNFNPDNVIIIDDMKDFTQESIDFNNNNNGKCGYMLKEELEVSLHNIYSDHIIDYIGPACVAFSKAKS
jgi:hypothetical protein